MWNNTYKAKIINGFINKNQIQSIIDLGCGDGNQLNYYDIKQRKYCGYDVSDDLIDKLKLIYRGRDNYSFLKYNEKDQLNDSMLTMSIDVIYHLIDDESYFEYMNLLFTKSNKYVIIYSSNFDHDQKNHIKHRKFSEYVEENFKNF